MKATPTSTHAERYARAVATLAARGRFGIRLGLGRTRALLRELGDPHQRLRGVLVAGTNGKGSVQALVGAVLTAGGYRIGQTPKPHLVSYRERIVVDGRPIGEADFADLIERIVDAAEGIPSRLGPVTEFELVTAAAFDWFARSGVEVAVVEVGMGGRLDAANTWDGGVAAITSVALDHTEWLGPTLTDIAREKAAIIKRGDLAVSGVTGEGRPPVVRRAQRLGVPLTEVSPLPVGGMDRTGMVLRHPDLGELRVGLLGRHQAGNAAVAIASLDALAEAGIARVREDSLRRGLSEARWPGRLELLTVDEIDVLLDGAHNPDGAAALARALSDLRPVLSGGPPVFLNGVLADKDVMGMVGAMIGAVIQTKARIVTTTVPGTPRALAAAALAGHWSSGTSEPLPKKPLAIPDVEEALEAALDQARSSGGPLIVFGSLGLVGHVRARLFPTDDASL